ncbi:hypothetical protein BDN70DRAFT_852386 [Pholiota conissans]|uniref:Elongator complex protein 6 n=1 Tax=Pholiota conissans TaxID=109636 RepID=A0A9P5Z8B2_9AGAR|nr:hypothetical protein BDN70DRAFT_852386 [Pholiota conissans]
MFRPSDLPDGIILLITDELAAPADFLLHRTLATLLKERQSPHALILSVSEGITRWRALASKSNVNLQQHLDAGSLEFVDVLSEVHPPAAGGGGNLTTNTSFRVLVDRVQAYLDRAQGGSPLIILDDITTLEWIGFSAVEITRFSRALRSVCLKANATLLIRHHIVTPNEPDDLFRHLLQISNYHLEVRPLSSGRSGEVSGEISLHPGFSAPSKTIKLINRSTATQYRLTDVGPVFFAKGTSGGVL